MRFLLPLLTLWPLAPGTRSHAARTQQPVASSQNVELSTIGDTVWLERSVPVPPGVSVRPRPLGESELLEPLAPPQMVVGEQGATLRYPVVFWRPGRHAVEIPGPILVRPDGWSDTLGPMVIQVSIGSILPRAPIESIPPRPPAPPVARAERSLLPAVILLLLAIMALIPIHLWWRRRGKAAPVPLPILAGVTNEVLDAWLAAGEHRAALAGWSHRLRAAEAKHDGATELMRRLEQARYGPLAPDTAAELADEARTWLGRERVTDN